ncbi:MAG: extracellular solute-binding protein [Defluviitaleaceae bacterium]|nr:extracellular solute-binding protein [Defluviitaleaceae bacterium]MCL2836195.1 extracellular solute-binding protein [Defluviitaleaceae bacterium]
MSKSFKRFVALLIAAMMLFAACATDGAAPEVTGTRDFVPVPAGDWNVPYETTVHVTSVANMGNDWVFETGDSMHNQPWTRAWKEDLNIEVTWDWLTTGDAEYITRLNMAIASGTLPDVFRVNYLQFLQLMEADLLMDITEYYENNLSQRIRDYELTDPDTIKTVSRDGRIYGVPQYYYGVIDAPRLIWVRKDWYEAAGSPEMNTVAQFEELAKGFMAEYGGYGMATCNTLEFLFFTGPMFGVYLGNPQLSEYFWYPDETGRIKAGVTHPEFRTALEYWAKWYQEGIISPDFASIDNNRMHEDVVNGRTGIQPFWQWHGWMNGPNLVAVHNEDAYMIPLPFPTVDGSQVLGQVVFPNVYITVVNKDAQNPAAAMKLLSYTDYIMFDPNTVLTEEQFRGFTDGQREHACGPFGIIDPMADMLQYQNVSHALHTGDTSQLFTSGMQKKHGDSLDWIENRNPAGLGAYLQQGRHEGCSYYHNKFLVDNNFLIRTSMWGPPPLDFHQTANTGDIIAMGVMEIILGSQPVEFFDTVLAEWYANGGQILEDSVNAEYGN